MQTRKSIFHGVKEHFLGKWSEYIDKTNLNNDPKSLARNPPNWTILDIVFDNFTFIAESFAKDLQRFVIVMC